MFNFRVIYRFNGDDVSLTIQTADSKNPSLKSDRVISFDVQADNLDKAWNEAKMQLFISWKIQL